MFLVSFFLRCFVFVNLDVFFSSGVVLAFFLNVFPGFVCIVFFVRFFLDVFDRSLLSAAFS